MGDRLPGHSTGVLTRLQAWDRRAFAAAHRVDAPVLDRVLPPLTSSADHGRLWFAVAAGLALAGRRRAAVRGLASLAAASAVANGPAKLVTGRSRPGLDAVPVLRRLSLQPSTSSFPSGHSASAAAFALGVALEDAAVAVPVAALAAGVAWGRVHTGVHYPGDVAAGAAVGAASALLVTRVWPRRVEHPAASRVAVEARPCRRATASSSSPIGTAGPPRTSTPSRRPWPSCCRPPRWCGPGTTWPGRCEGPPPVPGSSG